jgi:hypothetical protein
MWDYHTPSGWDVTLTAEVRAWENDGSWSLRAFVQKSF